MSRNKTPDIVGDMIYKLKLARRDIRVLKRINDELLKTNKRLKTEVNSLKEELEKQNGL